MSPPQGRFERVLCIFEGGDLLILGILRGQTQHCGVDHRHRQKEIAQRAMAHFSNPRAAICSNVEVPLIGKLVQHFVQRRSRQGSVFR